jgi:hypothetical protein
VLHFGHLIAITFPYIAHDLSAKEYQGIRAGVNRSFGVSPERADLVVNIAEEAILQ